jgi:thioredoxin reductase
MVMEMDDYLIIGGGPAALKEALFLIEKGKQVAIVSEQYGGIMKCMHDKPLQSYQEELTISNEFYDKGQLTKISYLSSPSGKEFTTYIEHSIKSLPIRKIIGKVTYISHIEKGFLCTIMHNDTVSHHTCSNLILATGLKPRPLEPMGKNIKFMTCIDAYKMLADDCTLANTIKKIVIIGSGNSAFQLALQALKLNVSITILASKYLGIFPQETHDKFALRALSQNTVEYIWKSQNERHLIPVSFFVYENLNVKNNILEVRVYRRDNDFHIAKASFDNIDSGDDYQEVKSVLFNIDDTLFISAVGMTGNIPDNDLKNLELDEDGFVVNYRGKTKIHNLYVCGTLAGYRSVDTMNNTEYCL